MERHISRNHPDEYLAIGMEKKRKQQEQELQESQRKKKKKEPTSVLNGVKLSMEQIKQACVKLVTQDGRPFAAVEDEGLQDLLRPLVAAVPQAERMAITAESVRADVSGRADEVRAKIKEEVAGKLICLKVDGVTRMQRSFLGINIQYVKDGRLHLRTLAVRELLVRHTAENLKRVILEVLGDYGVKVEQIYSFTCDNGANMVRTGFLLREDQENEIEDETDHGSTIPESEDLSVSDAEEEASEIPDDGSDQEFQNEDDDIDTEAGHGHEEEVQNGEDDEIHGLYDCQLLTRGNAIIVCVRCAAHTLQLAIHDTLKSGNCQRVISQMRNLCVKLRTPNIVALLKGLHLKTPTLDVPTRWNSTYDMLLSVLPLKQFCKDFKTSHPKKLFVSEIIWRHAEKLVRALQPAKVVTMKLQEEQLLMGDFYGTWLTCKLQTEAVGTPFAKLLLRNMEARETILMNNDAFLGAIYMDPRYFSMLTHEASRKAEEHLKKLWARLERFSSANSEELSTNEQDRATVTLSTAETSSEPEEEELSPLEKLLAEKDAVRLAEAGGAAKFNILPALKTFRASPRLKVTENVLAYWEARSLVMPQLYELAKVALAVPATQVSVERVFSGVRFILSDRRYNLTSTVLDDIIVIRYESLSSRKHPRSGAESPGASSSSVRVPPQVARLRTGNAAISETEVASSSTSSHSSASDSGFERLRRSTSGSPVSWTTNRSPTPVNSGKSVSPSLSNASGPSTRNRSGSSRSDVGADTDVDTAD